VALTLRKTCGGQIWPLGTPLVKSWNVPPYSRWNVPENVLAGATDAECKGQKPSRVFVGLKAENDNVERGAALHETSHGAAKFVFERK